MHKALQKPGGRIIGVLPPSSLAGALSGDNGSPAPRMAGCSLWLLLVVSGIAVLPPDGDIGTEYLSHLCVNDSLFNEIFGLPV